MVLEVTQKRNGMQKVVLTDAQGRAVRFDGSETDFNGHECALWGLVSFLAEKDQQALSRLASAFPEGLLNFGGRREF